MIKFNWLAGVLALAIFSNAQYQGWSLFGSFAGGQAARTAGSSGRSFHK
ncbi:MAG: hypothetical protein KDI45_00560 [Candidatus Accumulibacter sp.]|nr:hypothetical protein [Accumulibacter sp.]MCB1964682.1 hypothetical protein [Accumulibacter sp.]